MRRFSLRDLFWLTLVVALALGMGRAWWLDREHQSEQLRLQIAAAERTAARWQIRAEVSANVVKDQGQKLATYEKKQNAMFATTCWLQSETIALQSDVARLQREPSTSLAPDEIIGIAHKYLTTQQRSPFLASYHVRPSNAGFTVFVEFGDTLEPDGRVTGGPVGAHCTLKVSEGKVIELIPGL